jgi:hypothetical protein
MSALTVGRSPVFDTRRVIPARADRDGPRTDGSLSVVPPRPNQLERLMRLALQRGERYGLVPPGSLVASNFCEREWKARFAR